MTLVEKSQRVENESQLCLQNPDFVANQEPCSIHLERSATINFYISWLVSVFVTTLTFYKQRGLFC